MTEEKWDSIEGLANKRFANIGHKLHKAGNVLLSKSRDLHFKLVSQIHNPSDWLINAKEHKTLLNDDNERFGELNLMLSR